MVHELDNEDDCGVTFVTQTAGPSNTTYQLPPAEQGLHYRFVKEVLDGSVTILPASGDVIADGTVSLANTETDQDWANVKLVAVNDSKWIIAQGHGTWVTT